MVGIKNTSKDAAFKAAFKQELGITDLEKLSKYEPNFTDGSYVVYNTGNILTASNYSYSDLIQVFSKKLLVTVYFTDSAGISFYDINKTFISGFNRTTETLGLLVEITVPTNAMYFKTSCLLANKGNFNISGNADANINIVCKKLSEKNESNNSDISANTTDILNLQLFDLGVLVDGFVNSVNGEFIYATSYKRTGYLRINATTIKTIITYQVSSVGISFYDRNKVYISGFDYNNNPFGSEVTISVPTNAYYFATCAINAWVSSMRVRTIYLANFLNKAYINLENPCFYNESKECAVFKKILCIGDSLTEGRFEHNDGGTNVEYTDAGYSYPSFLKYLTGRDITNAGDAGETTKTWWKIHQNDNLAGHDACIIALGRNDYVVGSETTSAERIQYMTNIVNKVKADNPQIKIFISTMINYYTGTGADAVNADMRTIASTLADCYLIDISTYGKMRMGVDNYSHCTAVGYQKLAGYYFNYISWIIKNNQSNFKNIQFIGTTNSYT
jgi:lysophospholipase L1-like esterase